MTKGRRIMEQEKRFRLSSMTLFLLISSSLPKLSQAGINDFNARYDPWKALISEADRLKRYVNIAGVSTQEQESVPTDQGEILVVKMLIANVEHTHDLYNKSSTTYANLTDKLSAGIDEMLAANPDLSYRIVSVGEQEGMPLVFLYVRSSKRTIEEDDQRAFLRKYYYEEPINGLYLRNASSEVYVPVERYTVYELYLQLYDEPFVAGMGVPGSVPYLNMTDQMQHLVGTRFKNLFGEHFYRLVVYAFSPSVRSMIVRVAVLLDPDQDNLRYAATIWYNVHRYVRLGKFPLLPGNVEVVECKFALKEFHGYLNDRSYRRLFVTRFENNPILLVTLPAILAMAFGIVCLLGILKICHNLAFDIETLPQFYGSIGKEKENLSF